MSPRRPEALRLCLENLVAQCEGICAENLELRAALLALGTSGPPPSTPGRIEGAVLLGALDTCTLKVEPLTVPGIQKRDHTEGLDHGEEAWTDCNRLHPCAVVGGEVSLASSRLGLLRSCEGTRELESKTRFSDISDTFNVFYDRGVQHERYIDIIVHSVVFQFLQIFAIAANSVYLGFSADRNVRNAWRRLDGLSYEGHWVIPDILFLSWFTLELALRCAADGKGFFAGQDLRWNLFDGFLVGTSCIELALPGLLANVSFLRILRVFRIVRVVRVVRTVKALQSLRTMIFALMNSFICLVWAFVMITMVVFVFSVIFTGGVETYFESVSKEDLVEMKQAVDVNESFGTLYSTMVSLFSAITGGNDWMVYGELLRFVGGNRETYFLVFVFYIGFCTVGMLNVVTGIFVDSAVCTRTDDEVVQNWKSDLQRTSDEVRSIFQAADKDASGTMSYEELAEQLENPRVRAYFSGLDIDPSEVGIIFTLLDTDGDNAVTVDEFIQGTMRLKGCAKSVDIMTLMFDQAKFMTKFNKLCSFMEENLNELKDEISPGSKPLPRTFRPLKDMLVNQKQINPPQCVVGTPMSTVRSGARA